MRIRVLLAAVSLSCLACDGNDFPELDGRYAFEATLDGVPSNEFNAEGDLIFLGTDEETGRLSGFADVFVFLGNETGIVSEMQTAFVTREGEISFRLRVPNTSTTWTFVGEVDEDGDDMEGTHTLQPSRGSGFPGIWRARR